MVPVEIVKAIDSKFVKFGSSAYIRLDAILAVRCPQPVEGEDHTPTVEIFINASDFFTTNFDSQEEAEEYALALTQKL